MQARSEETRAKILQSAMNLFGQQGYDGTGVAGICAAAQVSKGAFYHHFASKQAVFLQLLEEWLQTLDVDLSGALAAAPNVVEGLLGMAARTGGIFSAADGRLSIFLEFWVQARKDPEVWRKAIQPFYRYRESFAAIVRRGIGEGTLRAVDPDLAALALVSLSVGIILQGLVDPQGAQWDRAAQDVVRLFVEGLESK